MSRQSDDTKDSNTRKKQPLASKAEVNQTKAKKPKFEKKSKKCVLYLDKTNYWTQDCFKGLKLAKDAKKSDNKVAKSFPKQST